MPSRLARRDFQAFDQLTRQSEASRLQEMEEVVAGPWAGYVPDLNPNFTDLKVATGDTSGFVAKDEVLGPARGWSKMDPNGPDLPLGHTWANDTGAATPQPVNCLHLFRQGRSAIISNVMAATGKINIANDAHLFRFNNTGNTWEEIGKTAGSIQLEFDEETYPDCTTFAPGVQGGGGGGTPKTADVPVFVMCSKDDQVIYYPDSTAGTQYENLLNTNSSLAITARSVSSFQERLCFLNYTSGATSFPRGMLFTVRGDGANITGVGAGNIQAEELDGEGVAIRSLGDILVGYFTNGIVFYRRTFDPLNPFTIQYVSKQVGLLGTKAVVQISETLHFAICDDGWFWVSADGNLQEVGLADVNGSQVRKWSNSFYMSLDWANADKIQVGFDPDQRFIYISWPTGAREVPAGSGQVFNDRVWIYDIAADRVWVDAAYGPFDSGDNVTPTCFAQLEFAGTTGPTWDTITGTWASQSGSWASIAPKDGQQNLSFGTFGGFVMNYRADTWQREDESGNLTYPALIYETPVKVRGAQPPDYAQTERVDVEYVSQAVEAGSGDSVSLRISSTVDGNLQSSPPLSLTLDSGLQPTSAPIWSTYAHFSHGGLVHSLRLQSSGTLPHVFIRSIRYRYRARQSEATAE